MVLGSSDHSSTSAPRNRIKSFSRRFENVATQPSSTWKTAAANQLASELWKRLPFSQLADETGHRGIHQLTRVAAASHKQIVAWYGELSQLVESICRVAVEIRGQAELSESLRSLLTSEIMERMKSQVHVPLPLTPFVEFELANLDPEVAMRQVEEKLVTGCLDFVNHIFEILDRLQEHDVVGRVYLTESSCRFTFARGVAIVDKMSTQREQRLGSLLTRDPNKGGKLHTALFVDTIDTAPVHVEHRNAIHVHDVGNPTLQPASQTKYPLPVKYREFIDACPRWLRPSLRVLEGDLLREQHIERDLKTETKLDEVHVSTVWRCPGIVFGDYVFAGWGEQVIAGEEARLRAEDEEQERQQMARMAHNTRRKVLPCAIVAIGFILFSRWATPVMLSLAVVTGAVAMLLAYEAERMLRTARQNRAPLRILLRMLFVGSSVYGVQAFLFSILHFSLVALGLTCLFGITAWILYAVQLEYQEAEQSHVK